MSGRALVYLHGFASSPRSSKARFFAERTAGAGWPFACPDLNLPDFGTLTVTRMIEQVAEAIRTGAGGPVALVGSSLGAFVALHALARPDIAERVDRVALLAPALDLVPSLEEDFGPEKMAEWERTGRLPILHYGDETMRELGWGFMVDARRYDSDALGVDRPTLVYQGTRDDVVSPESVRRWAASRPHVELHELDDGHMLHDHVELIWAGVERFLGER